MTTLGKTLTVIIVLLSICLMMFAGAVYKSGRGWRTEADGLRKQLNDTNNNLTQAQKELESVKTKLTQERDAQKDTANEALASLNELKDDYEEQENLLTNARQERSV